MNRGQRRAEWRIQNRRSIAEAPRSGGGAEVRSPSLGRFSGGAASVKMRVGEIVLRGFEKRYASRIASAFERHLTVLLRSGSLPSHWTRSSKTATLQTAPLRINRQSDITGIGENLARVVFELRSQERGVRGRG